MAHEKFKKYKAKWDNQLGLRMKAVQIDGAGELAFTRKSFCEEQGVSAPHPPSLSFFKWEG
jgi:hypothetical protein